MEAATKGAEQLKEDTLELIAAKKLIVYSHWLDLNNLGLMLLGTGLELAAAWFKIQYAAGSIAGNVAFGGLACQGMSVLGWYGSPGDIVNGQPQGGIKTLLFAYFGTMLVGSMYCGWTLVILVLFHREAFERSIGDALDHVYKQMDDYETRIAGDHEIASLSLRYTRTTYTVMLAVAGSLFLGAYASGQLLGFRKIVKRFLQVVNIGLVVLSSLLSVSASYVYETQTFAEDDAQSFVGMLILAGVFLGIVSLMGVYAVKYENGALSRLYIVGLVCLLVLFIVMMVLGFIYQSVIPKHFEEMYRNRFENDEWNRLFGVMSYEEVQTKVESNLLLVVVGCSVTVDGLILAILGQMWLGQNNKEDIMLLNFHTGDEPMAEQVDALDKAAAEEMALIQALKEEARIKALVEETTDNPLVGDGV